MAGANTAVCGLGRPAGPQLCSWASWTKSNSPSNAGRSLSTSEQAPRRHSLLTTHPDGERALRLQTATSVLTQAR